jgi:GTPase Era involved in 16S rRNA processing
MIPEFAILGHPNEGKSSVLSTLAEDDSVRVSATPGETIECRTFPVIIDGTEVLRFTDTPGFQNPGRVLSELKKRVESGKDILTDFREFAKTVPELHDDRELLAPVERGAGIIYVVDGSRPVRNVDRAEMEILRLTGKPRMAVINCKDENSTHLEGWKTEFRKNFNSNRLFNAHRATYAERILLLEALKSIDQDWQQVLTEVLHVFKKDWKARNQATAEIISETIGQCLGLSLRKNLDPPVISIEKTRKTLQDTYKMRLEKIEHEGHKQIRALFKHNIFQYDLPPHSLLHEDLLDEKTWQLLGLTQKQTVIAGGLGGAVLGAGLDVAALGHGLGLFTAMGGVAGAVGALLGGEKYSNSAKVLGVPLGGEQLKIGPVKSMSFLLVLINRSFLYYKHTINWAHGRRDYPGNSNHEMLPQPTTELSFTGNWSASDIKVCHDFFKLIQKDRNDSTAKAENKFRQLLLQTLQEISESEG